MSSVHLCHWPFMLFDLVVELKIEPMSIGAKLFAHF